MSNSKDNKPKNEIPEDEQPLGGLYDEDEEKDKLDSIKNNFNDAKDKALDMKDDFDDFRDFIDRFKNSSKDEENNNDNSNDNYNDDSSSEDSSNENSEDDNEANTQDNDTGEKDSNSSESSKKGEDQKESYTNEKVDNSKNNSPDTTGKNESGTPTSGSKGTSSGTTTGTTGTTGGTAGGTAGGTTGGATGGTATGGTTGGAAGGAAGGTTGGAAGGTAGGAAGGAAGTAASSGGTAVAAAIAPAIPVIVAVIITVIILIGIIGFFTVMPGMILGKLKKFGFKILEGLKGAATGNSKIVTKEEIKGVAQYIQNLGYDIESYGFADVKYKKKTKKDEDENNSSTTKEIEKMVPVNRDLSRDYLSAYITADAQTYVPAKTFLFARVTNTWDNIKALYNGDELKSIDQSSSGLINILDHNIPFFDSKDTVKDAEDYAVVNTKKRKLYINTKVSTFHIPIIGGATKLAFGKDITKFRRRKGSSYAFDLESWTAMYGRPLELFIALHTATMMPDLSQKIAKGSDFNTKVNIELFKSKMTYDLEINSKDGKKVKFSYDTEKYSETDEPIKNAKTFVENFLNTAIEPDNPTLYKSVLDAIKEQEKDIPDIQFQFFYEIWKSGKKSQAWYDFDGKLDYKIAVNKLLIEDYSFEFEDGANTLAIMKKEHSAIVIGGVEFSPSQYYELAQLIAKGMTPQDMYYPIIKDVTNHWFYGTIDFFGTKGKVSHGAYRRARIVEKRIKYATDAEKAEEDSKISEYDDIIFEDIEEIINRGITQEDINKYRDEKVKPAQEKYDKIYSGDPDNPSTGTAIPDDDPILKNKTAYEHTLEYLEEMYKKQQSGETEEDDKTPLQSEFDIYLDTRMKAIDGDRGIFYQASEPELLGPSDKIKKVFSKSYYQYDGTAETAKKIAAAQSIDRGLSKYYYAGEEYDIEQKDRDEKEAAKNARKEGDVENEYYSSPMVKRNVNFEKNKKNAFQTLAMLESMKTHASEEVYKNIKELLYSLEYFTEEELTNNTKQILLWIADNGEVTGHEKWKIEKKKIDSKPDRDDATKYNLVVKNLKQTNMKIVAPENAIASYSGEDGGILTLSFIEMSPETYDILNYRYNGLKDVKDKSYTGSFTKINKNLLTGYTMKIKGIKDPGKAEFKRGETIVEVKDGMTAFGDEDNGKVELSLINEEGSPHDSIEEYMEPDYTKTDEDNLKKQMEQEKEALTKAGYIYTGSAPTISSGAGSGSGGNSEGIDFGAGNYTEFNLSNAEEKALNEEQKALLIYTYLTERGITPNQAAGIIGNNIQECSLGNLIWGYDGGAMGMFQHTDGERTALEDFLRKRGKAFQTQSLIEDQLDYCLSIYKKNFYPTENKFRASNNMDALGYNGGEFSEYLKTISHIKNFADQEAIYGKIVGEEGGKLVREDGLEESLYNEFKGYADSNTHFYDMFMNSPSPETAATAFCRGYERPESANARHDKLTKNKGAMTYKGQLILPQAWNHKRRYWARKYFDKFTNQAEIDRIKASFPKQPTTHDSRAFVARTVQGGTVAGNSDAGANTAALANGTEIGLNASWKYANFSKINSGKAKFYKTTAANPNGIVVTVNAGHGTKNGSSEEKKTQTHPDGTAKITDGSTPKGAKMSYAITEGMTFSDGKSEAEITLDVALRLRDKLLTKGYNVLMIRETSDVQLDNIARTVIANNNSHAHIAIHYNSTTSDAGAFYMKVTDEGNYKNMDPVSKMWQRHDRLGESLLNGLQEKGMKIRSSRGDASDLTQTSYSTIPSVDIELGDKITPHDGATNDKMAEGLLAGINKYFDI